MDSLLIFISLITSIIALLGAVGSVFYWKGKMDTRMCDLDPIPAMVQTHNTKIDVLWALFVDSTLEGGKFAVRGSGYKLTEDGEKCVGDIAHIIQEVKDNNPKMAASDVLTLVAQRIGMAELQKLAKKNGCTSAQYLAILTIKLGIEI